MKRKKKSNKLNNLLIGLLIVLFIAVVALGSYYILTATGIQDLFPEGFFDFSQFSVPDNGASDLESIIAIYEPVFAQLEASAIERLEELYQAAAEEYREGKRTGTLDRFRLTNKYLKAGRQLQLAVDDAFDLLLGGLEKELRSKNLPLEIIPEIKAAYEKTKQEKKEELFNRIRERIDF